MPTDSFQMLIDIVIIKKTNTCTPFISILNSISTPTRNTIISHTRRAYHIFFAAALTVPRLPTLPLVFLTLTAPLTSPLRRLGELRSLLIGMSPFPVPELRAGVFGRPLIRFSTSLSAPASANEVDHSRVLVIVVVLVQETARRLSDATGEREARRASIRS
jgi:hypothetical protein